MIHRRNEMVEKEVKKDLMRSFEEEYGKDKKPGQNLKTLKDDKTLEEKYGDDIQESKQELNFEYINQIAEDTQHLHGFDIMDYDLGLTGEKLNSLKKAIWYYHNSLRQYPELNEINRNTKIDNRTHLLLFTPPGQGKSNIKNVNKKIVWDFDDEDRYIEVAGVSHPEQLVGKIKYEGKGKNKTPVEKKGLLGYNCVMSDEAQTLINEESDVSAKSQRLKRIAMDSFMNNEISKKLVDDSPGETLSYYSPSNIMDFAHPVTLTSAFFDTGSFRRYFAFKIEESDEIDLDEISDLTLENKKIDKSWKEYLDKLYQKHTSVKFEQNNLDIIKYYHKVLSNFLLKSENKNLFRYGVLTKYSLKDLITKNVFILAKSKHEKKPSIKTTIEGCFDTILFILRSVETYNKLGNMGSTSDVWGGVSEENAQALEFLHRKKYFTKESSIISIKGFIKILANFHGVREEQARKQYYKLKKHGYIDSKQTGTYETRVWLKYIPKECQIKNEIEEPLKFWKDYIKNFDLFSKKVKEFYKNNDIYDKKVKSGEVGLLCCVLSKFFISMEKMKKSEQKKYIEKIESGDFYDLVKKPAKETQLQLPKDKPDEYIDKEVKKKKSSRDTQFNEACETQDIKPQYSKNDVLEYINNNQGCTGNELYDKFGVGTFKYIKEMKQDNTIYEKGDKIFSNDVKKGDDKNG